MTTSSSGSAPESRVVEGSGTFKDYRGEYPAGAVDCAIDGLELSYSYIRDQGNTKIEELIDEALRLLRIAKSYNEPVAFGVAGREETGGG